MGKMYGATVAVSHQARKKHNLATNIYTMISKAAFWATPSLFSAVIPTPN